MNAANSSFRSFGPKWQARIDSDAEKMKEGLIPSKPSVLGNFYFIPVNPLITEEKIDGRLGKVMYLMERSSIVEKEESTEVLIVDVNIPCSVVVD